MLDDLVKQTQNNPAFCLVGQPLIKGGNFKLMGHVISLILTALCTLYRISQYVEKYFLRNQFDCDRI